MRKIRRRKSIKKKLHKRRACRQPRRMTENIQKTRRGPQGPKTYEAIAPSRFNISNIDELIKFLQETTNVILNMGWKPDGDCAYGLDLVFNLLRDKLDVVSGTSKVPFASALSDAPEWNPSAGGADE